MNDMPSSRPASGKDAGTMGHAAGVLMALVPCTTAVAHRILDNATRTSGAAPDDTIGTVIALRGRGTCAPAGHGPLERAVWTEIERARTARAAPDGPVLLPPAFVLRQHVDHLRAARRRTLAAPDDPAQRAELENSLYTLCVLTGRRSAYAALVAAEAHLAAHRLPPAGGPVQLA